MLTSGGFVGQAREFERATIFLEGRLIHYVIKRSRRARCWSLRIDAEHGLVIILPNHSRPYNVLTILKQKTFWILKHLERWQRLKEFCRQDLQDGFVICFMGRQFALRLRLGEDIKKPVVVRESGSELLLFYQPRGRAFLREFLLYWLRRRARREIPVFVRRRAEGFKLSLGKISIRDQKTRWGSCCPRAKNLTINWRLSLAPPAILDYVVCHELAHLTHPNHSQAFWRTVEQLNPDYKSSRAWLRRESDRLRLNPLTCGDSRLIQYPEVIQTVLNSM